MLASRALGVIHHTLGKKPGDLATHQGGTELDLLNEAGQQLYTSWPWMFNERHSRPLHLVADQPWVGLPPDFGELLGEPVPSEGLLQLIRASSPQELLELRTSQVVVDTFTYWYAVESEPPSNANLLSSSESFNTTPDWNVSSAVVTANTSVSPTGKTDADTLAASGSNAGRVFQDVPTDQLTDRSVYVASVYLKAGTAATNDLELSQQGTAATPETSGRAPKTVVRVTWAAGVPSVALLSSQGEGAHDVGVQTIADGWYRVFLALSFLNLMDLPSSEFRFAIRPDTVGTTGTVLAWGAQLERYDASAEGVTPRPGKYENNGAAPVLIAGEPLRRLGIYPTPTTSVHSAFAVYYRRRWEPVNDSGDTIEIPDWIGSLFLDFCRASARGAFEEDDAFAFQRYEALCASATFEKMTEYDHGQQRSYGPMRTAAHGAMLARDWSRGARVTGP